MLIQTSGNPGKKRRRNEDGGKHKRDTDHRARHFAHRLQRRIARRHSFFDVTLDRFDHHNRVVHNKPDRQHQAKKRKRVDRESEQWEQHKRSDQRYRNRAQRNQRSSPALQKDKYDDDDQRERLEERFNDVVQSFSYRKRLIERDSEIHVRGKTLLRFGHQFANALRRLDRIGSGQLVTGEDCRRLAVQSPLQVVGLRAEIDARDVFHPNE